MTTDRRSNTVAGRNFPSENVTPLTAVAGDTITPGQQLVITGEEDGYPEVEAGTGDAPTYLVAVEKRHPPSGEEGRTPSLVETDYDEGEMVEYVVFRTGDTSDNLILAEGEDATGEFGSEFVFTEDGEVALYDDAEDDAAEIAGRVVEEQDATAAAERIEVIFA